MKITTRETLTTTEIECTADELRQSNSLADGFTGILRRCFNGNVGSTGYEEEEEESEEEENE